MTNFEKIKRINVEDIAELLTKITANCCEYCPLQKNCENQDIYCRGSIKQWLESEAE